MGKGTERDEGRMVDGLKVKYLFPRGVCLASASVVNRLEARMHNLQKVDGESRRQGTGYQQKDPGIVDHPLQPPSGASTPYLFLQPTRRQP